MEILQDARLTVLLIMASAVLILSVLPLSVRKSVEMELWILERPVIMGTKLVVVLIVLLIQHTDAQLQSV